MSIQTKEIYRSPNGDAWYLAHDLDGVFVRHQPNPSSGGKTSDIEIGAFLREDGQGAPEKRELLRLIATLVEG